jgi:adenylate cyclase
MNNGFIAVLEKPVSSANLLERVAGALAITRLREENTRLKTLIPLYQLGKKFLSATTANEIYLELVNLIYKELSASSVSLMMLDKTSGELRIVASKGMEEKIAATVRLQPGEKIAGWVFSHGKPLILNRRTQGASPFAKLLHRKEIAAAISYPLVIRGDVAGVVNISDRDVRVEYSQADMEMLSVICSQAIMALENVLAIFEREQSVRLRTLFEQYVAPEVAEFLLNREERMIDVGEVKNLTVLFADIRNFTGLVQHISSEELRRFLNQFFELFTNIIFTARGTLDKFMGDAALVLFGAPVTIDAPAVAAVGAAVEILKGFEDLRGKWVENSAWFSQIGIGIGISSGEVYLGNVGSEKRLDFTVIGTNVNIAQRLASETNSGQILITESVCREVSGTYTIKKEGARLLRGLDQDIQVYSVVSEPEVANEKP